MELFYLILKATLFAAVLRAFIAFDAMQRHALFLASLYTALLAFISWVFLLAPQQPIVVWPRAWENQLVFRLLGGAHTAPAVLGWRAWQMWLAQTFLLMTAYFKLLTKFEDGLLHWVILAAGLGMIIF